MPFDELKAAISGNVIALGDNGYAGAREGLIWNGRKPEPKPWLIVRAASVEDVQATVRFAAQAGLTVSPRGTGHNFSGIAVQDGIVLDLSALNHVRIDAEAGIAEVGPTVSNGELAELLTEKGFAFPLGHCGSVSLSGYLLGGGFGWNSGEWGMACHSVESADVVLADGRLVTASATENPELYWAVRGAGPEFFGVVVRYRLRLQRLRSGMMSAIRMYPLDRIDEVSRWMMGVMAVAPRGVEFTAIMHSAPPPFADRSAKLVSAIATVFAETEDEAREALDGVALWAPADPITVIGPMPVTYAGLYAAGSESNPEGARYLTDAVWGSDAREIFLAMAEQIAAAPSPASLAIGSVMPATSFASRPLPEAAFSMVGAAFGALYAIWNDATDDAVNARWLRTGSDKLAPVARGHYVGEADLARPGTLERCYAPGVWERLKVLRANHDPQGRFSRGQGSASAAPLSIAAE